ncbi:MAG TPA: TetR family transcriptional regulator [Trebonia sp.]|jgi:AcrR family transcriptional regulator
MAGLRERKKEQTRQRIAAVAVRLFAERGFDAVTVNEIAEAAEVSKATLFAYFPSKESLVLGGVAGDDLAAVAAARPPGQSFLAALRDYFRGLAAADVPEAELGALITRVRVITGSPALRDAANALLYRQRRELARALARSYGQPAAELIAAQVAASLLTVQETYFQRLLDGASAPEAARLLARDVELAFDLLEHGISEMAKGGE